MGYLSSKIKSECFGCEACVQVCPKDAISLFEDVEGFRYPLLNDNACVNCGLCYSVCPYDNMPSKHADDKLAFGGYHKDDIIRDESTSGGAFSAIVDAWCDNNYIIFGAKADGLGVYHTYISDKSQIASFRKSKYSQSVIGSAYSDARRFLNEGRKVLFSGTPCQIAGLLSYLRDTNTENLLTVEVICEGVPSPHFIRRYDEWTVQKHHSKISLLDYRFKDGKRWDYEVMETHLENGIRLKKDRWFNPFWSIWLNHLMSRPSCYSCPFTTTCRVADISLGDLWGVHLYCPELYGDNGGSSLIVCNTEAGKSALNMALIYLYGHELSFDDALRYQSPMRKPIDMNPNRTEFMQDVLVMEYKALCKKWAKKSSLKLLISKYVWGTNKQVCRKYSLK